MKHYIGGKDYLGLLDYTPEQMMMLLEISQDLKRKWVMGEPHAYLRDQAWAMIFEKKSTRTRNSFHAAATALGAQSFYLRPDELQTSRGEPIADTAKILDRYFDGLYIRTFGQEIVEEFADNMKHPVINALTSLEHPCQGLCDLLTIREKKGDFKGLKIGYSGDIFNVCHSLMLGAAMFGMDITVACPDKDDPTGKPYGPEKVIMDRCQELAEVSGATVKVSADVEEVYKDADIIYGNTYHSMGDNEDTKEQRVKDFIEFQANKKNFSLAKKDAIFMHCLPGYVGEDMTEDIKYGDMSVIFDQGENRMHSVKAVLVSCAIKS